MKHLPVGWLAALVLGSAAWTSPVNAGPSGKFAFERGDDIWTATADGTGAKKITNGQSPDLSPNGARVVYETVSPDNDKPKPPKLIMLDFASGKSTTLDTQGQNIMDPLWSPDGKQIVFTMIDSDSHAHIDIINADGTGLHTVDSAAKQDYWDANWAADGQSLFAQDFENIYRLDLTGKVLKKWVIATLIPKGEMSSSCHLNPSPDGKTLLMDIDMDEDSRAGWDGPPPAIYLLDLATEKATRLTPVKFYAWSCRWLSAPTSISYVSQKPGEDDSSIYSMTTTNHGKDSKLLVKKASYPSAAR